jgi:hypothetical protein
MRNTKKDRNESAQTDVLTQAQDNVHNLLEPRSTEELVYADEKQDDYGDAYNHIIPIESSGTNLHDELWMSAHRG